MFLHKNRLQGGEDRMSEKTKKYLGIVATCILCVGIIVNIIGMIPPAAQSIATPINDWGLSYQKEGEPPVGNADQSYLQQYDAYYLGDTSQKVIYLTFDAGYENGNTEKILDVLKKQEVPAAFFLVGHYIKENPELIKRMCAEGHIVGNHTANHPDMSKIASLDALKKELEDNEALYKEVTGQDMPKYYRPPAGKFSEENLKNAQSLGYKTVFWSLAYVDWYENNQPTKEFAFSKLLPRIHSGAIVLLHSTSETNANILDELITKWKEEGYEFRSLDQLP